MHESFFWGIWLVLLLGLGSQGERTLVIIVFFTPFVLAGLQFLFNFLVKSRKNAKTKKRG
jgi:hypothetical protein